MPPFLVIKVYLSVALEEIINKAVISDFKSGIFYGANKARVVVLNVFSPFPGRSNSKPYQLPADRSTESCSHEEH